MTTQHPEDAAYGMPSRAAMGMMRARCLLRGIDHPSFDALCQEIDSWRSWPSAWARLGERFMSKAEECQKAGFMASAGELALRAGVAFHFGKALAVAPTASYRDLTKRSVDSVRRGLQMLDPTFERVVVPAGEGHLHANLRRPLGAERPPLVLLIPGTESTKEEFPFWEETFLRRGMATLSIDGPGQGETGLTLHMRHDYEAAVSPLLDALADRSDIDHQRIGATGISLGGYYAIRAAAAEPRIRAVVANCGPWALAGQWEAGLMPPLYAHKYIWGLGAADETEARLKARPFTLDGVAENVDVPALVIFGGADVLLDADEHGRRTAEALARGELWMFEDGNHGVTNRAVEHIGPSADWLRRRLDEARR
ncbi:alpha/beta hydrolase family protein [Streptomyces sp. NPDC050743]|uniref:alpha/beta hydrolase family protein n=1 Tax=Streptomyces sp. NPDC050743 TaxID=3365634 RepID=UPI00378DE8F8